MGTACPPNKERSMQGELFKGVIVKDPVRIRLYLAQCLRILEGKENA